MNRPYLWAVSYFVLIPLFALLYAFCLPPGSFYHSTVRFEPATIHDKVEIETQLRDSTLSHLPTHGRNRSLRGWTVDALHVYGLKAPDEPGDDAPLTFTISLDLRRGAVRAKNLQSKVTLDRHAVFLKQGTPSARYSVTISPITTPNPTTTLTAADLFPSAVHGDSGEVSLSEDAQRRLAAFVAAQQGFPSSSSSGQFGRMLYFSVVTITTVGYGDVTPLTNAARVLTGMEATAGIVAAGLFLNALAYRRR